MFGYYLDMGLRSLRRNPALTVLMVMLIGVGVASSMVTYASLHAMASDPMPGRSAQLFAPQVDNQGPVTRHADGEPPMTLSYVDATALLRAHRATRQTAMYAVRFSLVPADPVLAPFTIRGYTATDDFFVMFTVPFQYGGSWGQGGDAQGTNAIVISSRVNDKLFGGANSVGREVRLDDHDYRIVGVSRYWNPQPRFYSGADIHDLYDYGEAPDIFLPFSYATQSNIQAMTYPMCKPDYKGTSWKGQLHSECDWIDYWVQLPTTADARSFRDYLHGYAAEQQLAGRFQWAPNVKLRNLMQWLDYVQAVPEETRLSFLLAVGLQLVCLMNIVGLLLAKFMRRRAEIGVRRALGASRRSIYGQFLTEAAIVGSAGGALGLVLTIGGVFDIASIFEPKVARLVHVDVGLLSLTLLVSVTTTLLAALYPTWRAAHVQPAWQLKSN